MTTSGTLRRALVSALCVATTAGCGQDLGPFGTGRDSDRARHAMYDVAADEDATPAEVIEAGGADEIEVSGTGHRLVGYLAESDDDEGPQVSAWRLYDPDGAVVAEGPGIRVFEASASPQLWPLADGVLMAPDYGELDGLVVVGDDGVVTPVPDGGRTTATQAGDVVLPGAVVYRPADRATYRLPPLGVRDLRGTAVDDTGGLWLLPFAGRRPRLLHCPTGAPPCAEIAVPAPSPSSLDVLDGVVYTASVEQTMDGAGLSDLLARDATAADAEPWREVDVTGIDTRRWYGPGLTALGDGVLLVGEAGPDWYTGAPDTGWTRVTLPDGVDADFAVLVARQGRLYATGRMPADGYVSDDLGETWSTLER